MHDQEAAVHHTFTRVAHTRSTFTRSTPMAWPSSDFIKVDLIVVDFMNS